MAVTAAARDRRPLPRETASPRAALIVAPRARGRRGTSRCSPFAAVTRRPRTFVVIGPRQRIVAPLAGNRVDAGHDSPSDDEPAADARAENDAEDDIGARRGAISRLGNGETVRVVGQPHGPAEPLLEILMKRPADQPRGVGVLDQPGRRRDGAGNADADRAALAGRPALPRRRARRWPRSCRRSRRAASGRAFPIAPDRRRQARRRRSWCRRGRSPVAARCLESCLLQWAGSGVRCQRDHEGHELFVAPALAEISL